MRFKTEIAIDLTVTALSNRYANEFNITPEEAYKKLLLTVLYQCMTDPQICAAFKETDELYENWLEEERTSVYG